MRSVRFAIAALFLLAVACGDSDSTTGGAGSIAAELTDDSIKLSEQSAGSGDIALETSNAGTMVHEIEVFSGSETDLPVENGVAITTDLVLIDEIEDIIPGGNVSLNLNLDPGNYVILCNLPGHYQLGMVTSLTVSG